jgi:Sugar-binding cellulase-like
MSMAERYLGSGTLAQDETTLTAPTPGHLPPRLSITLWDFSWYTRAGAGEPYADLDALCATVADRGFTTLRICAAPLLLFGNLQLDDLAQDLAIEGMGRSQAGDYIGRGTRWYNTPGGYRLDLRSRFFELLRAAQRSGLSVALSSWEYQQAPAFAASSRWFDAIDGIPLEQRYAALAGAWDRLLNAVTDAGYRDTIAFIEIHNEVDFSILPPLADGMDAVSRLAGRHPDLLVTASYGKPPHLSMYDVPAGLGLAQFHVYAYGVLEELQQEVQIRSAGAEDFPNTVLRGLLRPDTPPTELYGRAADWKYDATVVTDRMFYGYDWIDPESWDRWLHERFPQHRLAMEREIESRIIAISRWARKEIIPAVIGEGWIGYTPLFSNFEESAEGCALAEFGVRTALDHGVWGVVLGSNVAPHHPAWALEEWQRSVNATITQARS